MLQCIEFARGIASSDLTILITGESGTGKELFAQSIHNASERSKQPFVAFNCAAVPESLMESELFGYEGGSFTGALREGKVGLFEQANSGTVFLDEIGDMPYTLQAKLLRVLQERQVTRVGSQKVFNVNIRVIAATNNNLREKIKSGQYRSDLYYRLNVLPLIIPPLRERQEDIIYLLHHFFEEKNKPITAISSEAHDLLLQYKWPGNIRELENVASYLSYMANAFVEPRHLPHDIINCQESFDWEFNVLVSKCYWEKSLQVLSIVAEFNALDKGAGRKSIEETLANKNVVLREGEIRRILALLAELEFIHSGIGRRGSEITFKGKSLLNWSRNR
jgi:transcriptional regulator with PAS, ATPase and Fis domain